MISRIFQCLILTAFLGTLLPAHENFEIVGTVTKVQANQVDVKTKTRTVEIGKDEQTSITRDGKKVGPTELKVGQSVVVEAFGDSYDDLYALEVRISPPAGTKATKAKK